MLKNIKTVILLLMSCLATNAQSADKTYSLKSTAGNWEATINSKGAIESLKMCFNGKSTAIPWRTDEWGGPSWQGVDLHKTKSEGLYFEGKKDQQTYSIEYADVEGQLTIIAELKNESNTVFNVAPYARLNIGIDNELKDPATYFQNFFPTLLRCEKTHFWGYFQNPNGQILAIGSPDAVASRQIEYIGQGHRIATSSLDMLHVLPLPPRHPQELTNLAPRASKKWRIILQPISSLSEVTPAIATICKAPSISLDRTTIAPGEQLEIKIYNNIIPLVNITNPSGKELKLPKPLIGKNFIRYVLPSPKIVGNYTITAKGNEKVSEAIFHVRKPWGWYLKQARAEALRMQIKPQKHREGWLGFFSAYWAQLYFPDDKKLAETEKVFKNFYSLMVDTTITDFYHSKPTWDTRPQNTSWIVGMMTARYAATKKIENLEEASKWGDLLIRKFQLPNGAYKGYTALTLGSKFLSELAWYERQLAEKDSVWKARYKRHVLSVKKATANLYSVGDLGDTEGQATYEDNQAGSAWSLLALDALNCTDTTLRRKYIESSLEIQKRHECLTQALIPDGRMRGGTLRFWEAQYDILTTPNMMNSPHGWTMRSQFGALYLYLLTGEERFLNIMNNAMGACVQAIDEKTGTLRWAFVPDPYIEAEQFVQDSAHPGKGKIVKNVIGEQWLPMISDWWRVPEGEIGNLTQFKELGHQGVSQGWSCDNDVHEHFRVLTEEFVPNAFVLEREDGSLRTLNCAVKRKGNTLYVNLPEKVVSRVHFNLKNNYQVVVPFSAEKVKQKVARGMHWVGPGVKAAIAPDLYLSGKIN
ncbi:hypothetical protein I5M32_11665 [Pedobacter sp. SD-b]|uniref:Alpha-L-rhamnosidase six-hairpin glycosidase domain-containing protein n=1 Tax=Pedobacter segetis TaxID=2793069 RepID=A0ABS1BL48_9SPHI|nr:hypothetical protein [Pedobacter segetis]MBK0383615.1 hypothetical protein [Pedobacter segetis]